MYVPGMHGGRPCWLFWRFKANFVFSRRCISSHSEIVVYMPSFLDIHGKTCERRRCRCLWWTASTFLAVLTLSGMLTSAIVAYVPRAFHTMPSLGVVWVVFEAFVTTICAIVVHFCCPCSDAYTRVLVFTASDLLFQILPPS